MFNTPILFILFNRTDTTQKVFEKIREIKPCKLYVACDGPRLDVENEPEACKQTQNILKQIDWDCELKCLFLDENIGPSRAPYQFIKWFFSFEERGIVLEHDCLPHLDFFYYCEELLERFKDNPKVGFISGNNFAPENNPENSYLFSVYNNIWGWASWRRTIDLYDLEIKKYKQNQLSHIIDSTIESFSERIYWKTIYQQLKRNEILTWDYYLTFTLWNHKLLSVVPSKNLVSNIGFDDQALHTTDPNSPIANLATFGILPLIHPQEVKINKEYEPYYMRKVILQNKGLTSFYVKIIFKRMRIFKMLMKLKNAFKA